LRLEHDDVDDRVVEIPAPEDDLEWMDFMSAVDSGKDPNRG
jgi:hypothetical protein